MKYKLYKVSAPGWIKEFNTEEERRAEMYDHICSSCREGDPDSDWDVLPVTADSSLDVMLSTSCGCEYMIGEDFGE